AQHPNQLAKELADARKTIEEYGRRKVEMHEQYRRLEERADKYLALFLLYGDHVRGCGVFSDTPEGAALAAIEPGCTCGLDIEQAIVQGEDCPPRGWHAWRVMAAKFGLKRDD
ncbi:MAG TPA: hypothetical protein VFI62_03365, partial [Burkholderiales bacterium]|nr:hypothetical protein [Burkholderiales bacterium]